MISLCIPDPDSFWAGHEQIALFVYLDSVGDAVVRASLFFSEDSAVGERAVGRDLIDADVSLVVVIDVEALSVG